MIAWSGESRIERLIYIYTFLQRSNKVPLMIWDIPVTSTIWKQLWRIYLYGIYILEKLVHNSTLQKYQRLSENNVTREHFHHTSHTSCSFPVLPICLCPPDPRPQHFLVLVTLRYSKFIHSNYYFKEPMIYQTLSVVRLWL